MAYSFALSIKAVTDGEAIWAWKEAMVTAGWGVARSGDGTGGNYSGTGDVLNPGGPYTGKLDLATAWFELRQPVAASPRRSFLLQRPSATTTRFDGWYSSDGTGFTGGAQTAAVRGTAADEQQVIANTAGWLYTSKNSAWLVDVIMGGAAEGYNFLLSIRLPTTDVPSSSGYDRTNFPWSLLCLDVLDDANAADTDPAVVGVQYDTDGASNRPLMDQAQIIRRRAKLATNSGIAGWFKKGLAGATWVGFPPVTWGGQNTVTLNQNNRYETEISDQTFQEMPIIYHRGGSGMATQRGKKGRSALFRSIAAPAGNSRLFGFGINKGRTRLMLGALTVPWDGITKPVF